ncbi:MAG: hypothetical protein EXR76_11105 [Myxococcales bacterium]|nr:hypothetical protein [Myxococcales bacterium]
MYRPISTTILDLANAVMDQATATAGSGPEADALANAVLAELLRHAHHTVGSVRTRRLASPMFFGAESYAP